MQEREIAFTPDQKFWAFIDAVHKQHPPTCDTKRLQILALDPGETTGTCWYSGGHIVVSQWSTKDIGSSYDRLHDFIRVYKPDHLRFEDYRIYSWKSEDHAWSPVHTIQWIGAIKVAAHVTSTPNSCLMAANVKKFWTDDKLNLFGLNPKGLRHGRDALRHLLYYLLFPTK